MFLQSDDEQLGQVLGLVLAIVIGVIALVLAAALYRPSVNAAPDVAAVPPAAAPVAASAPAAVAAVPIEASAQATSDAASVTVEYGVVKFYFASGDADLAEGAAGALMDVVKAARSGKKVLIAGFHDSRGNTAANADLARRRAQVVQDALRAAGAPDRQISLQRPVPAGPGPDAEARRVEITVQ